MDKRIACIAEEVGGYYVCADGLGYIDCRGRAYPTKADALSAAYNKGFTHARGSGTYWGARVRAIPFNAQTMDQGMHERGFCG